MRNRLLVVDGDPRSRRVLDVNLRGAGFDVQTASDGSQAWSMLEDAHPDLIVCDADSADVDAFALCARVRARPGASSQVPFLLLSASRSREQKIRALEAGADDFLTKPAYLKEILTRVRALLRRRERDALTPDLTGGPASADLPTDRSRDVGMTPFAGDLAEISVVDLVQLVEHNGRSGIIHLRGPTGSAAFVYFRDGHIIDAEVGRLSGLDALARLFSWTTGTFEIEWKSIRRKDVVRRPSSELVLEGMQRLDAWNELRGELGDPSAVFEVDYRLLAERLAEIPDEVNSVLRLCDGVRTVMQVVEESSLPDTEALTALLRLREEGIVHDKAMPRSASEGQGRRGWREAGEGPSVAMAPGAIQPASAAHGPIESPGAHRRDGGGEAAVPAPAPPRRTAPGLGQNALSADGAVESAPERMREGDREQSNVIPFRAPLAPPRLPERAGPTVVGFVPVTAGLEPEMAAPAEEVPRKLSPAEAPPSPALTLPLGRAEDVALLRDLALREQAAPAAARSVAAPDEAAPGALAPAVDTNRGFGPAPPASEREPSPPAGVPVEVIEEASGAVAGSGPTSAPTAAEARSQSGRVRAESQGDGVASGAIPSAPSGAALDSRAASPNAGAAMQGQADATTRPQADATTKVTFADGTVSRNDALAELGLPSRWRGVRVMVGAAIVGVAAAVGVSRFVSGRGAPESEVAAPAVVPGPPPAPSPPGAGVIAAEEPKPPPVVELPAPGAAPTSPPASAAGGPADEPGGSATADRPPAVPEKTASSEASPSEEHAPGQGAAAPGAPAEHPAPAGSKELSDCRTAFARNRWREALTACTAAAAANPRSALALTLLAHTELNRGRLARANELAEKAVAIDPDQADAYVIIGGVHQDSGQNREAKAAYRRYLDLAPRGRYADELRSIVNGL